MTYYIESLPKEGDYRLIGLQHMEKLDDFLSQLYEDERLWIDELDVFVTASITWDLEWRPQQSFIDYTEFKLDIEAYEGNEEYQCFFYGKDLMHLASTITHVLALPDPDFSAVGPPYTCRYRNITLWGREPCGGRDFVRKDLILSPAQLRTVLSTNVLHRCTLLGFNLSPSQSIVLAETNKLNRATSCSISDQGL
jgi:hypothetical protein